jgi:hypothetical protein
VHITVFCDVMPHGFVYGVQLKSELAHRIEKFACNNIVA